MIYIRVDSNPTIASGHVMRCLSIAEAVREQGREVTFLVSDSYSVPVISSYQFPTIVLNSQWDNLMPEVDQVRGILSQNKDSLLLIDTYSVTKEYVDALTSYAKICYLGSKGEYLGALTAIINYSTNIDYAFYENNYGVAGTKMLLGPAYAPLRKEYRNLPERDKDKVENILLTTGNSDRDNMVEKILKQLLASNLPGTPKVQVVIGSMFTNKERLHTEYDANARIVLHENVREMWKLMSMCDLAISANGTTVYELAASHVPAITFAMVEEQVASATKLGEIKAVEYCGQSYGDQEGCIAQIVEQTMVYCNDASKRKALRGKAHEVIDGAGSERIVSSLLAR